MRRDISQRAFGINLIDVSPQRIEAFGRAAIGQHAMDLVTTNGQHIGNLGKRVNDLSISHAAYYSVMSADRAENVAGHCSRLCSRHISLRQPGEFRHQTCHHNDTYYARSVLSVFVLRDILSYLHKRE